MTTATAPANTRISLLQIFFDAFCHADGKAPDCQGCEHNERLPNNNSSACTHPERPENNPEYNNLN